MQRKTWYSIFGVDAMPLFLKNLLLNFAKRPNFEKSEGHIFTNFLLDSEKNGSENVAIQLICDKKLKAYIFDENSKENLNVKSREWGSLSGLFSNFC